MPENDSAFPPPEGSTGDSRRRPQHIEVDFHPSRSSPKSNSRHRHSHGRAEHSIWQFGAGIVPPAAFIGATLAVLTLIKPEIISSSMVRFSLLGIAALIAIGLGTIFYGLRPGSKRLERKEVWIAMIAGIVTLLLIGFLFLRSRIFPTNPADAPTTQRD